MDAAADYLLDVAEDLNRPVRLYLERGDASHTVFIAPRGWTEVRLQGWIAGYRRELVGEFDEEARMGTEP